MVTWTSSPLHVRTVCHFISHLCTFCRVPPAPPTPTPTPCPPLPPPPACPTHLPCPYPCTHLRIMLAGSLDVCTLLNGIFTRDFFACFTFAFWFAFGSSAPRFFLSRIVYRSLSGWIFTFAGGPCPFLVTRVPRTRSPGSSSTCYTATTFLFILRFARFSSFVVSSFYTGYVRVHAFACTRARWWLFCTSPLTFRILFTSPPLSHVLLYHAVQRFPRSVRHGRFSSCRCQFRFEP